MNFANRRPAGFTERTWNVKGLRVFGRVFSKEHVPPRPLILVHGLGVSGRYMIPLARNLAKVRNVIVPDLPGFGRSEKPAGALTIPQLADVVAAWTEEAVGGPTVFVGNSMGCQVIVDLAVRYPRLVDQIVLVSPTVDRFHRRFVSQLWRGWRDLLREPWQLWWILFTDYWKTGFRRMRDTLQEALSDRVEAKLPRVSAPALVIHGTLDTIVTEPWALEVAHRLPNGELFEVAAGTHAVHFARPTEIASRIVCFTLASAPQRRPVGQLSVAAGRRSPWM